MISVRSEVREHYTMITFQGELVYGQTQQAKKQLKEQRVNGNCIINLTQLNQIDSTGFGVLIHLAKTLNETKVVIVVEDELIYELFLIAKFHLIFKIVKTLEEAIYCIEHYDQPPMGLGEY